MQLTHRTEQAIDRIRNAQLPAPAISQIAMTVNQDEYGRRLRDLNAATATTRKLKKTRKPRGGLHKKLRAIMNDGRWRTLQDVYTAMDMHSDEGKQFVRSALGIMRRDNILIKDLTHHRVPMWRLL